ncbi:MAG: DNA methyltransferase [Bryobacteraceae bacterium]
MRLFNSLADCTAAPVPASSPANNSESVMPSAAEIVTRLLKLMFFLVARNPTNHTAVFPIGLCEQVIATFCPPNGLVVDPFAGSGSTLIAAQKMGRRSMGFEMLEEHFNDQAKRILKETKSPGAIDVVDNYPEATIAALLETVVAQQKG